MDIVSTSTAYGGSQAQRLLASLFQQQGPPTGQDVPGDSAAPAPPPAPSTPTPPTSAPDAAQFASTTLASLLDTQQGPPSADSVAQQVISAVDANGDGSLSLDEVEKALGQDSNSASSGLTQAFAQLDTNGDGNLSQDELSSAISAQQQQQGTAGVHHHHHHHHHAGAAQASDGQLGASILGQADADGDGALSADEIAKALGTSGGDSLKQTLAGFDKDGDGKLDSSELAAAIEAFRAAQTQGQPASGATANTAQPVTA